jgi:MarR family transcriptional regulator, organic hydroperoxide resistance regulator
VTNRTADAAAGLQAQAAERAVPAKPPQAAQPSSAVQDSQAARDDLLLEQQLCFALTVASRGVVGAYKPVLDKLGLTHPQYLVMLCLWEASPRSVRDISEALAQEPATISPLLRRLETAGFITRQRMEGNERTLDVRLTPRGAALREQALQVPGIMMARLGLTREQVGQLHASMVELIAATRPGSEDVPRR